MNEVDDLVNFILDITSVKTLGETEEEHGKNLAFIYNFIKSKYSFLTVEEIKEAFRIYIANQFDIKVFRIIDCIVVGEVLTSYVEHRNNMLKSYVPADNSPKLESITESGKEDINKKAVNRVYSEFKESQSLPDGLTYIYEILVESGLIKVPGENTPKLTAYYTKKMEQAKEEMIVETKKEIEKSKLKFDKINSLSLHNTLKSIQENNDNSIILRAKKLVLKEFFVSKILANQENIFYE